MRTLFVVFAEPKPYFRRPRVDCARLHAHPPISVFATPQSGIELYYIFPPMNGLPDSWMTNAPESAVHEEGSAQVAREYWAFEANIPLGVKNLDGCSMYSCDPHAVDRHFNAPWH